LKLTILVATPRTLRILLLQILEIKIEFFLLIAPKVLGAIAKKQNPFSKINHIFYLSFTWRSFFWINWSSFHIYALKQNYRFTYLWSKGIQKSLSYRGCQFLPNYSLFFHELESNESEIILKTKSSSKTIPLKHRVYQWLFLFEEKIGAKIEYGCCSKL
jgi:ribonuclease Z